MPSALNFDKGLTLSFQVKDRKASAAWYQKKMDSRRRSRSVSDLCALRASAPLREFVPSNLAGFGDGITAMPRVRGHVFWRGADGEVRHDSLLTCH